MSREIGGYLELERYQGEPYHPGAVALNSARNCLAYLAELRGIERIVLPDLMCDAVSRTCEREGIAVRTFEVGEGFALPSELAVSEGEWLYVADYYGRLSCSEVERARSASGGRLVVDEVQGFFREPWAGVDTIYTCRKFFGVPDGAYLVTRDGSRLGRELPKGSSRARMAHVVGRMEDGSAEWYGAYRASEESIDAEPLAAMSETTRSLMAAVDFPFARRRREENYAILGKALGGRNRLAAGSPEGPYMYPLLVEDSAGLRDRLAEAGVFVPTLWPNVLADCPAPSWAHRYARDVLPLPVDQRYNRDDMEYVASCVKSVLR